jgi:single-stranded-DNA-specific exonuclease
LKRVSKLEYSEFDTITEKLAAINGIKDYESYLSPSEGFIGDPYQLKNIHNAINIVQNAVREHKNIKVFYDPDADGLLSGSILYEYLNKLTDKVKLIGGSREKGHGLNTIIDEIPEDTQVLIVVDSSSSDWKECKQLKEKGVEVLIIDHHLVESPNYYCTLVNPQQEDCNYTNKSISCSALVWQFCRVLDDAFNRNDAYAYVDLAALGLISDMMDMSNMENRAIVNLGLDNVENIGIRSILSSKKLDGKKLSTTDIGFNVTNLLNAAARMNELPKAIELLTAKTYTRADELVKEIGKLNQQRKKTQTNHADFVKDLIDPTQKIIIILDHEKKIGKNFAGLIANDVTKQYQRPCLILSPDAKQGNTYAGSFRSYNGFDIRSFFESIECVNYAAGHAGAGGVGVDKDKLQQFVEKVQEMAQDLDFEEVLEYDLELNCKEINGNLIDEINDFYRITGNGFPMGKILVKGLYVGDVEITKNKDTVKIICGDVTLMKFRTNETYKDNVPYFTEIEAVGTLNVNCYYNFQQRKNIITNQLYLDEYRTVG